MHYTLEELAALVAAELSGSPDTEIGGVKGMDEVSHGQITFIDHPRMLDEAERKGAAAIIAPLSVKTSAVPLLKVKNPRIAFAKILELFYPETD